MGRSEKVIIVEGLTDKRNVQEVLNEPVKIICTNGTIGISRLDKIIEDFYDKEVFILVDADESGEKLRKMFKREFPEAKHLYIDKTYKEVAAAPKSHLSSVLLNANIQVKTKYFI